MCDARLDCHNVFAFKFLMKYIALFFSIKFEINEKLSKISLSFEGLQLKHTLT